MLSLIHIFEVDIDLLSVKQQLNQALTPSLAALIKAVSPSLSYTLISIFCVPINSSRMRSSPKFHFHCSNKSRHWHRPVHYQSRAWEYISASSLLLWLKRTLQGCFCCWFEAAGTTAVLAQPPHVPNQRLVSAASSFWIFDLSPDSPNRQPGLSSNLVITSRWWKQWDTPRYAVRRGIVAMTSWLKL
jgi:hypothetical protein